MTTSTANSTKDCSDAAAAAATADVDDDDADDDDDSTVSTHVVSPTNVAHIKKMRRSTDEYTVK